MNIEQILYLSKQSIEEALIDPARLILGQGRVRMASKGEVVVVVEAKEYEVSNEHCKMYFCLSCLLADDF